MNIDLNLEQEKIELLAYKLGYRSMIEDTTQEIDGDSYPLIENPVIIEEFIGNVTAEILSERVRSSLRQGAVSMVDNLHNQAREKIAKGVYDQALLNLDVREVLQLIISDHDVL